MAFVGHLKGLGQVFCIVLMSRSRPGLDCLQDAPNKAARGPVRSDLFNFSIFSIIRHNLQLHS